MNRELSYLKTLNLNRGIAANFGKTRAQMNGLRLYTSRRSALAIRGPNPLQLIRIDGTKFSPPLERTHGCENRQLTST